MGFFDFIFKKKGQQAPETKASDAEVMLEGLLQKASADENFVEEFYRCLLSSEIYVLVSDDYDGSESLPVIQFNEEHIPIFSSVARIMDNDHVRENGVEYVRINAEVFFKSFEDTPIILNPFSDYAKVFTPAELQRILSGEIAQPFTVTVPKGTEMAIGIPAHYPEELEEALTEMFSAEPEIKRAYILLSQVGSGPRHLLIVADYAGDLAEFVSNNRAPLDAILPEGVFVDFATIDQLDLGDSFYEEIEPFYVG